MWSRLLNHIGIYIQMIKTRVGKIMQLLPQIKLLEATIALSLCVCVYMKEEKKTTYLNLTYLLT